MASEWALKYYKDFRGWENREGHFRAGIEVGYAGFIWDSDVAGYLACVRMNGMVCRGWGMAMVGDVRMINVERESGVKRWKV